MQIMIDVDVLKKFMEENKMSKSEFCQKCKISPITLQKILNKKKSLRFNTIFKIARYMNIKTSELLSKTNAMTYTQIRNIK
ncbi:MAG TPA: hypothetical protein DCZ34_03750 [Clostridiales bacterium]|nr:hypothetical protein [Clostridiales bacterium]